MSEKFDGDIGMQLKIARIRAGLTQQQAGTRIGMSENMLSKIETGRFEPPRELVVKLRSLFESSLGQVDKEVGTCP